MHSLRQVALVVALGLHLVCATTATAMELVMFDASWCGRCQMFKREVLPSYWNSRFGASIRLRILRERDNPWFHMAGPLEGFPTFVLVDDGVEVARFSGYASSERFYRALEWAARAQGRDRRYRW